MFLTQVVSVVYSQLAAQPNKQWAGESRRRRAGAEHTSPFLTQVSLWLWFHVKQGLAVMLPFAMLRPVSPFCVLMSPLQLC